MQKKTDNVKKEGKKIKIESKKAVSRWLFTAEDLVRARISPCGGSVVDKLALGQVFVGIFVFPVAILFHSCSPHTLSSEG
jgi:hypothetical protein